MGKVRQPAAPIAVLVDRINWHIDEENEDGLLHGLKYFDHPVWRVDGDKDLPNLSIIDYSDSEEIFPGQVEEPKDRANTVVMPTAKVMFMLCCKMKYGLYSLNGSTPYGLLDWISFLRDAMEKDQAGNADVRLKNTCLKPFMTEVKDNVVRDLAWSVGIDVTLYPRETIRATRSDLMDT